MDIRRLLDLVRKWGLLLGIAAVASGVAQYALAAQHPPLFEARATILVGPITGTFEERRTASAVTLTYRDLARSDAILGAVIDRLGRTTTPAALEDDTRVIGDAGTRLIRIIVRDASAEGAAELASGIADELHGYVAANGPSVPAATVIERAPLGTRIGGTALLRAALLAGAVLLAGAAVILVRAHGRPTVAYPEDIERMGLNFLGNLSLGRASAEDTAESRSRNSTTTRAFVAGLTEYMGTEATFSVAVAGVNTEDVARHAGHDIAEAIESWMGAATWLDATAQAPGPHRGQGPDSTMVVGRQSRSTSAPSGARTLLKLRIDGPVPLSIARQILRTAKGEGRSYVVSTKQLVGSDEALVWVIVAEAVIVVAEAQRTTVSELAAAVDGIWALGGHLYGVLIVYRGRTASRRDSPRRRMTQLLARLPHGRVVNTVTQ